MTIDKTYQPLALEKKWYQQWEKAGYFSPTHAVQSYCIMLPPPNVTGTLHMGHAFQDTIMDALIRYHRMKGYQTLWQGGTDHAGIATQMVVERQLQLQGISKYDLGREDFTDKIWKWKEQSGNTISCQMRRLGASMDWKRERFTMDNGLSEAVKEVFVRLYEENLIYRGTRLVNWDPKLKTAVSDLEVESEEEYGNLWYIRYPILNKNEYLVVATTRPETMLGDVAVAVHPEDIRYQHFIGEKIQLPLTSRLIPIIADEYVDPTFGTGCVKITPAHDFNDHEIGKRHQLEMINIFTDDAIINKNAPLAYQELERFKAREKIINDLQEKGLLEKIEPYTLKVPRSERSGEIVEPYLTDQWFVRTKPLAQEAIKVVESGKVEFVPSNWANSYFEWMNNIQDWCISRQIWWGHRIPAWYDEKGTVYVGRNEAEVRQKYQIDPLVPLMQDKDVLDTWFSSALWPFSTLGWPEHTEELKKYYPTNVLVTGFDIIFFWVARMIMMGLKFVGDVPFRQVFVTGLILDSHGQKMSKSKGNVLDPLDLIDGIDLESLVEKRTFGLMQPSMAAQIEKVTRKEFPQGIPSFGTDALRFSLCAFATTNRFIRFDLSRVEGYRNFCNKIWNASRFVFMNVEGKALGTSEHDREYSLADQWIWSVWQKTKQAIEEHFKTYRFDLAAQTIYDFTWNQYCDWYIELSKPTLVKEDVSQKQAGTRFTLIAILEELLRAMHPLMPFMTEEIWQKTKDLLGNAYFSTDTTSIMLQPYPTIQPEKIDEKTQVAVKLIQDIIIGVRNIRGEMNLSPHKMLQALYRAKTPEAESVVSHNQQIIKSLAKLEQLEVIGAQTPPLCAPILADNAEVFILLEGAVDIDSEVKRLKKELEKHQSDFEFAKKKLDNPHFVDKANPEAVEKERQRYQTAEGAIERLNKMLENLRTIKQ